MRNPYNNGEAKVRAVEQLRALTSSLADRWFRREQPITPAQRLLVEVKPSYMK